MSGGKAAKRKRQRAWRETYRNRIRSLPSTCPNCGQPGPHFVPPSGGGRFPGFFMCTPEVDA